LTMFPNIAIVALGLLATVEGSVINQNNGDIPVDSLAGRTLMENARRVVENGQNVDTSFLSGYSVKFQGCHHVQQWNEDADDEEDVRIMTKRLVRFRLCPSSECSSELGGCTSHYGDYIVDMETYLNSYTYAMQGNNGQNNGQNNQRNGQNNGNGYSSCTSFNARRDLQQNNGYYGDQNVNYYVGPYCAEQGGEIRLGLFTDDTCTSFAQSQYAIQGMAYTTQSMVSMACTSCSGYSNGGYGVSDFCTSIYEIAGKCESKMNIYYPNEAACSYIEGIKIIREDGVIRTAATKKSKAAAVAIGVFLTIAVLLAGYVYYLRTKLSRAKINLNASSVA